MDLEKFWVEGAQPQTATAHRHHTSAMAVATPFDASNLLGSMDWK